MSYNLDKLHKAHTKTSLEGEELILEPYFADPQLVEALNVAIYLQRPLLLTGEPGVGKTRLAEALAYEIHEADYKGGLFEWSIRSTTKAKEGICIFDAVRRLRDMHLADKDEAKAESQLAGKDLEAQYLKKGYLRKGALAKAFDKSTLEKPAVLLIDEIDKADIDFPNDLLMEIDKGKYYIDETQTYTEATHKPIIIITSNGERELPAAFLRRCVYFNISFPNNASLLRILEERHKIVRRNGKRYYSNDAQAIDAEHAHQAIAIFREVRELLRMATVSDKTISTSELTEWYEALFYPNKTQDVQVIDKERLTKTLDQLKEAKELTAETELPHYYLLLKNLEAVTTLMPYRKKKNA